MLFSSIPFLYYFLPIVFLLYFLAPRTWQNAVLLLASLVFYFYGERIYILLILFTTLSAYLHGLWIERLKGKPTARLAFISSIIFTLGLLGFFKYGNFVLTNVNALFDTQLALLQLSLPIGISFYSFQTLSYTIDVYRGQTAAQRNLIDFATYVTLFPQLIAGPIVRYADIAEELKSRTNSFANFAYGVERFVLGLAKKVLIANTLGELAPLLANAPNPSTLFYWLAAVAYPLHVYFDFSGYSDMAIGLGRIFGFHFLENFNYPFLAKSIGEFWRRWHISLGSWFRDYLYIPLGGSRVSLGRNLFNILLVWFLTGLWHGAAWNFVVWGLYFAAFLVLEKLFLLRLLERLPAWLRHLYVCFFLIISFVIFQGPDMATVGNNLQGLFGGALPFSNSETLYYLKSYGLVLLLALVGASPLPKNLVLRLQKGQRGQKLLNLAEPLVLSALLLIITAYLIDGSFNPFLYFRF